MSDVNPRLRDFDPDADLGFVPSPCISVCVMNAQTGLCEGCLRTIEEIVEWSDATDAVKRTVWVELKRRVASIDDGSAE
jgi:predicted Fe-S protein YdhL (DUF1289 family)